MDIQTRKLNFIESFLLLQNESIIIKLENLLKFATENSEYYKNNVVQQIGSRQLAFESL